jgi:DNA uptake protein ComE-like DNA-binding protein
MSEAAERDALTRLAEAERGGPIGGPAKEEGPHRMREADEAGDRAEGRYPIEAAPEEAEHDRLLEEPGTTERGLEGRREDEEELAQELEQAEQRLVAREERRLRALERAAARLEEVEGGAADAEARAVRAERLATLDAEGIELEGRFRETLDQIAEAERRASEAERRASEAERRAREAVERASRPVPSVAAEPPTPAPEPPAPAEEPSPPSPEPVAAERQAAGPVEHSAAAPNENLIDLNEASYEQLRELGLSVAQTMSLLAYRERSRGFESLDELDRVPGFPRDLVAELKSKVRV